MAVAGSFLIPWKASSLWAKQLSDRPVCVSVTLAPPVQGADAAAINLGATAGTIGRLWTLLKRDGLSPYNPSGEARVIPMSGSFGTNTPCRLAGIYAVTLTYHRLRSREGFRSTLDVNKDGITIFHQSRDVDISLRRHWAGRDNYYYYILNDALNQSEEIYRHINW